MKRVRRRTIIGAADSPLSLARPAHYLLTGMDMLMTALPSQVASQADQSRPNLVDSASGKPAMTTDRRPVGTLAFMGIEAAATLLEPDCSSRRIAPRRSPLRHGAPATEQGLIEERTCVVRCVTSIAWWV